MSQENFPSEKSTTFTKQLCSNDHFQFNCKDKSFYNLPTYMFEFELKQSTKVTINFTFPPPYDENSPIKRLLILTQEGRVKKSFTAYSVTMAKRFWHVPITNMYSHTTQFLKSGIYIIKYWAEIPAEFLYKINITTNTPVSAEVINPRSDHCDREYSEKGFPKISPLKKHTYKTKREHSSVNCVKG